jgi:large subunit ribosomal protein L22
MRAVATARFVRVSARKARLVLDQIRGCSVGEALATLRYTPRSAARLVEKVLRSAVANAEHNHQVRDLDGLRVVYAIADGGPSMKRVQPRAMGRAFFIKHRTSHLTIGVSDEVNGAQPVAPPRHMRRAPRPAPDATPTAPARTERRPERRRGDRAPARQKASARTAPAARRQRSAKKPGA